ncbi:MAG TPA: hypothetical protein VIV15_09870, partial [Anaerolineales bacterium]
STLHGSTGPGDHQWPARVQPHPVLRKRQARVHRLGLLTLKQSLGNFALGRPNSHVLNGPGKSWPSA